MTDRLSPEKRSWNMSRVNNKDTKIEVEVRKYLFSKGLRFRKNDKRYPGRPDIVLPKYHTIVFVNGCFWHAHEGCDDFRIPKTNVEFWTKKFEYNKQRDQDNYQKLTEMGWNVIIVWECLLKNKDTRLKTLNDLYEQIVSGNKME